MGFTKDQLMDALVPLYALDYDATIIIEECLASDDVSSAELTENDLRLIKHFGDNWEGDFRTARRYLQKALTDEVVEWANANMTYAPVISTNDPYYTDHIDYIRKMVEELPRDAYVNIHGYLPSICEQKVLCLGYTTDVATDYHASGEAMYLLEDGSFLYTYYYSISG